MTFATHRDDEYFDSLMAEAGEFGNAKTAVVQAWIEKAEATEAAARTKEIAELKFLWGLGDSEALRFDSQRKSFRWYRPQETSYHVDPEVIDERNVPAVVQFRGTSYDLPTYTYIEKTSYTPQELLASLLPKKYKSPAAGELYHKTIITDTEDAVELRDQMDEDQLDWLLRDEDDGEIVHRWNSDPEAEMTDEEKAQRAEDRNKWRTQQTAFLRTKLHRVLQDYFHTRDYRSKAIVTSWEELSPGRWTPAESVNVLDWIKQRVDERGELSGYASLVRSVEYRIAKRRAKKNGGAMQQLAA